MAKTAKKRAKILEAKYFGLFIGVMIIFLTIGVTHYTSIIDNLETKILDVHFRLKNTFLNETIQEGVNSNKIWEMAIPQIYTLLFNKYFIENK